MASTKKMDSQLFELSVFTSSCSVRHIAIGAAEAPGSFINHHITITSLKKFFHQHLATGASIARGVRAFCTMST